jgi:hypothetical protein
MLDDLLESVERTLKGKSGGRSGSDSRGGSGLRGILAQFLDEDRHTPRSHDGRRSSWHGDSFDSSDDDDRRRPHPQHPQHPQQQHPHPQQQQKQFGDWDV